MANAFHNIFACLVHESQECIVDLVRNLRAVDPVSTILLYNGGRDPFLLGHGFPFERYGGIIVPRPKPLAWGMLHDFALDCARFALESGIAFDTMTVVDSDQLATRPGYSGALRRFLSSRPNVGLIGSNAGVQRAESEIPPVLTALDEINLWRPFLRRFTEGESKFVHWTFWPGTVLTCHAARNLVELFDTDSLLKKTLERSKIWATEEVLLPTLVALLGYDVVASPFRRDHVRFRVDFTQKQVDHALDEEDTFWIHPITRHYGDPLRRRVRDRLNHYERPFEASETAALDVSKAADLTLNGVPAKELILDRVEQTEGWLSRPEADLLFRAASRMFTEFGGTANIVEVGSFCGRATIVLAAVAGALSPLARVHVVDSFDGIVGGLDEGLLAYPPTRERFLQNINGAGLSGVVVHLSPSTPWDNPIALILIDGLHDYVNVARDFFRFEPYMLAGAYLAFHDCADFFPGVRTFVNELINNREFEAVERVESLVVLRRTVR